MLRTVTSRLLLQRFISRRFATAPTNHDVIIIGGGIAGASAGYFLAKDARVKVALLERENQAGYHSTGRSAALFRTHATAAPPTYKLIQAARPFFMNPPPNFSPQPLLTPRGVLLVGRASQHKGIEKQIKALKPLEPSARVIQEKEVLSMCPGLKAGDGLHAVTDPNACDIDVHELLHGYLRGMKEHGAQVVLNAECTALKYKDNMWHVQTPAGEFRAPIVINAAGAWVDVVGKLAGVRPIGLVPKRRTIIVYDAPESLADEVSKWPFVLDCDSQFYFKPDGGRIWACSCDATPVEPQDVQPDEMDIAVCAERMEKNTHLVPRKLLNKWSGLRSFVKDEAPVASFDSEAKGFFWLAGQGGFGIQTSPSLGQLTAALALGKSVPANLAKHGLTETMFSAKRCQQ